MFHVKHPLLTQGCRGAPQGCATDGIRGCRGGTSAATRECPRELTHPDGLYTDRSSVNTHPFPTAHQRNSRCRWCGVYGAAHWSNRSMYPPMFHVKRLLRQAAIICDAHVFTKVDNVRPRHRLLVELTCPASTAGSGFRSSRVWSGPSIKEMLPCSPGREVTTVCGCQGGLRT